MLNFDKDRFLRIEAGALSLAPDIHAAIGACIAKGAKNVFFLGTGGAAILMQPAALLLQRRSGFPAFMEIAAELVLTGHHALGPHSIVVIPSLSGTTKESVATLDYCKARGATVVTLVGHRDTPLGQKADHAFVNFAFCSFIVVSSLFMPVSSWDHAFSASSLTLICVFSWLI